MGTPERPARDHPTETIIAFDFGLKRIGLAVGQSITGSATPLGIVRNTDHGPDFQAIDTLLREWRPARLVVGVPLHADGSASDLQPVITSFIEQLGRYGLPVSTIDERYTSKEAETVLKEARASGRRGRISRADIDSAAAVLIAERYLASFA